jgi:hypothetical protein
MGEGNMKQTTLIIDADQLRDIVVRLENNVVVLKK